MTQDELAVKTALSTNPSMLTEKLEKLSPTDRNKTLQMVGIMRREIRLAI